MGTKSKQEKRLERGKAKLPTLSVMGEMVQALKNGEISPPEATGAEQVRQAVVLAGIQDGVAPMDALVQHDAAVEGILEQPEAPKPVAAGPVLQVKQGLSLRGGRGEWYKLLCQYDGKPVADYIAAGKANPASHYTARSVKCGQPKTPESRLSWFKRAGIVTIK